MTKLINYIAAVTMAMSIGFASTSPVTAALPNTSKNSDGSACNGVDP